MVGLMVFPMVLLTSVLIYSDLSRQKALPRRSILTPLLIVGVIYGLSLPWLVIYLLAILMGS